MPGTSFASLADALRDRYVLERELGRGGMATVYLAEDLKHHRKVAVKVLRPELAASLGPDRFLREIEVAAHLQHPHILPVFDSGQIGVAADGRVGSGPPVLYYVMPFVEGESLRERLNQERQLPLDDALRLAREVADALSDAHSRGVIHRDIKPENILLESGHAVVADFGIARAISAAGGEKLTETGMAIGTPQYMSPEQATADREVDGRADIYSLGCVLYEMLTGTPPFTGASAQAVMARHSLDAVPHIRTVRSTVPEAVEHVVLRALAKVPADRYPSARHFADALAAASRAQVVPPRQRSRHLTVVALRVIVAGALAAAAVAVLRRPATAAPGTLLAQGVIQPHDRIVVADFENHTGDSLLAAAVAEAIRIDLAQSGLVSVLSTPQMRGALGRMERPSDAVVDDSLARELAVREGIKAFVTGDVAAVGSSYFVSAEIVRTEGGAVLAALRETAADSLDLIPAIDRLARRIRQTTGETMRPIRASPPLEQVTTASLGALRKYSQAIHAIYHGSDRVTAVRLLRDAVLTDTGFAMAYRSLGLTLGDMGEAGGAIDALTKAYAHRDRLPFRERYLTMAAYHAGVSLDTDRAVAAYRALLEFDPRHVAALNNLAYTLALRRDYGMADSLYRMALSVDSSIPFIYFGAAGAQTNLGQFERARATLDAVARRFPGNAVLPMAEAYLASGRQDWVAAERHARARLEAVKADTLDALDAHQTLGGIVLVQGRLREAEREFGASVAMSRSAPSPNRAHFGAIRLAFIELTYRGAAQRAVERVEAEVQRFPLASMDPGDRRYYDLAQFFAAAGRIARAKALIAEAERDTAQYVQRLDATRHWALGAVALAERRYRAAQDELRQAFAADWCPMCVLPELALAYELGGDTEAAISTYERYLTTPWVNRFETDAVQLGPSLLQLAALYQRSERKEKAAETCARLARLWASADPELRHQVARAQRCATSGVLSP